ncbi:lipoprotein [Aestuariirhabdus sp. Z084]|nr:lipoprotein [Aestuariirhabdus haliotis]MCL6416125.1 lipoprotein [Aestuariirhabdus haliotis]MCL6420118.1 lipoprotein [Aestuariirhabdus haliotis]
MIPKLLPLLLAIGLLTGCGQKGPLYLPEADNQYQSVSVSNQ